MSKRKTRTGCGLAFGVLASWGAAEAAAESPTPVANEPRLIEQPEAAALEQLPVEAGTEKITERYPSRVVKIERHVTQDADGNFVNHGAWAKWDEDGRLMGKGDFVHGAQQGKWSRFFSAEETREAFAASLALGFEAPFTSTAEFDNGHLHGTWIVLDAKKRQVSAWEFRDGDRHGKSISWFPSGKKFREVEYRGGELDGAALEFDRGEQIVKQERFINGYRHGLQTELYPTGEVKCECETLFPKEVVESKDDWWNGTTEAHVVGNIGREQRHGLFVAWNLEGQKILEGRYTDDLPDGQFTWWHDNGNKAIEGAYVDGKQHGVWTWWYSNGLKETVGEYAFGREAGTWRSWEEDGRLASVMSLAFDDEGLGEPEAVLGPSDPNAPPVPQFGGDGLERKPEPPPVTRPVSFQTTVEEAPEVKPATAEMKSAALQSAEPVQLKPIAASEALPAVIEVKPAEPTTAPQGATLKPAARR